MQTLTKAVKSQLDYSLEMLKDVINNCPNDLWNRANDVFPYWQQIYHTLYWADYNIQESFDGNRVFCWRTSKDITHELEENVLLCSDFLTKEELKGYLQAFFIKNDSFFNRLDDETLRNEIPYRNDDLTWFDILINQVRHIMYHVGYCDSLLKDGGCYSIEWVSVFGKQE